MGAELLIWLKWTAILFGAVIAFSFVYVIVEAIHQTLKDRKTAEPQSAPQIKKASPKGWAVRTEEGYEIWALHKEEARRRYLALDPVHNYEEGVDYWLDEMTYEQWQNLPEN